MNWDYRLDPPDGDEPPEKEPEPLAKECLRCEWAATDCRCPTGPLFLSPEGRTIIELIRLHRDGLAQEERMLVMAEAREGICEHCGIDNPRCQCWNDE